MAKTWTRLDNSLPHQIRIIWHRGYRLAWSCTCMREGIHWPPKYAPFEEITDADDALAGWRMYHEPVWAAQGACDG